MGRAPQAVKRVGALLLCAATTALGAEVLQTYFMPFPENDVQVALNMIDAFRGNIGAEMRTAVSIVPGSDGTLLYYDHWEDGYEADITSPTQATTAVWGDGNPANGIPPGFSNDVVNAGDVINLESTVDVARNQVNFEYDGRDKMAVTRPVSVARAMYAIQPGEVLAEACGVLDVSSHGFEYRAPVGVGTGSGPYTNECFEYSAFSIMGDYDFTRVEIDKDNDGVFEDVVYLDAGESYFVNGGVLAGATLRGSKPFQAYLITGDIRSNYEMRWYELWPVDQWDAVYYTPVGGRVYGADYYGTIVYVFNPHTNAITVFYETLSSTGSFAVSAGSVSAAFQMPTNSGGRFYTTNGSTFAAVQVFDVRAPGVVGECQDFDWGFTLSPTRALTTMGICGWGPGHGTTASGVNGNPVWVCAVSNTTLYVDFDGDPTTGPLTDPMGNRYDFSTNLAGYEINVLFDNSDTNQTGLRYYTLDGVYVMGLWGEDPNACTPYNPYLDMGYAVPPFPAVYAHKKSWLLIDLNTNGYPDAGDTLRFQVEILNVGFATAQHVIFKDDPPTNFTAYVTNSSTLNGSAVYDDLPPRQTRFPFDEGGYDIGTITVGATSVVEYSTTVLSSLPSNFNGLIHNNATVVGTNANWTAPSFTNALLGGLALTKSGSVTGLVSAGQQFTYTLTIANTGQFTYTDVMVEDYLPVGLSYVPGSTRISYPYGLTNTVLDRFDQRTFSNSYGTIPWLNNWQEEGEADGPVEGNLIVRPDTNIAVVEAYALAVGRASNAIWRAANLSGHTAAFLSFSYRRHSLDDANDYVDLFISTNGWATSNFLARFAGAASETNYTSTNIEISAWISTNTALKFSTSRAGTMLGDDQVWFDNVRITLTGSNVTFAGDAPALLAEGLSLPPGTSLVVTLDVVVDNPPTATQLVNTARTRAEQHPMWLYAWYTNQVNATQGLALVKSGSPAGLVGPGSNITYTITLANTGDILQSSVRLEDYLPYGVTYVSNSARVWRPFAHTNTILDRFDSRSYTNSNGNVDWAGPWQEVGESDGATSGYAQVMNDAGSIPGHVYALRINNANYGAWRVADLSSGYTWAELRFDYRRAGWEGTETAVIAVSSNGGSTWATLGTISGTGTDNSYRSTNFNISAYISSNTAIRILGGATLAADDYFWVDDVTITYSSANATNRLRSLPELFTNYFIPPHTSLVVTLNVTVDNPLVATQFINTARAKSDQQTEWLYGYATNWAQATSGMTLTKTSSVGDWWDEGETNTYTITLVNTGELAQTGVTVWDQLPSGVSYVSNSTEIIYWKIVGTNWVPTNVVTNFWSATVRDEFNAIAYTNQNGTTNWITDWAETGEADGPAAGSIQVLNQWSAYQLRILREVRYASRLANLAGATNAVFSFDYRRILMDPPDQVGIYASSNGGVTWTQIGLITGPASGASDTVTLSTNYNITAYISTNTGIRFGIPTRLGVGEGIAFDNVQISFSGVTYTTNYAQEYVWSLSTNAGGPPPTLMSNYVLYGNSTPATALWVRFKTTLDLPATQAAYTNAAYAWSFQTTNLQASVTDRVDLVSIGDWVWYDANTNGIQDAGETGIVGVTVRLYDANTNLLASTTTDASGYYSFSNRPAGSYFVEFVTPTNYYFSPRDQGGNDNLDSDADPTTGRTIIFSVSGGVTDNRWDAGLYIPPSSLGDWVWYDANTNGLQDAGESGVTNVTVRLYTASTSLVGTTTTAAGGFYSFTGLQPGWYFLEFVLPPGYTFTLQDQGGNDNLDSDASQANGRTVSFYLPSGVNYTNWDAGLTMPQSGLTITKSSDFGGNCWEPGDTITYTITVQNTGTVTHSAIAISDPLPAGVSYVSNSTLVAAPGIQTNTVRDEFNAVAYTNQNGTLNWANAWQEENDDGNPGAGDVQVANVWSAYQLRILGPDNGAWRQADLSGYTNAVLSFDYRRIGLDNAGEYVGIYASSNGGASWTEVGRLAGPANDASTLSTNFNITAYVASNTAVRFYSTNTLAVDEGAAFDNVQILFTRYGMVTNAGGAPPSLASGYTLAPGETMTVTFQVTVDTPGTVTQVLNQATATSATHPPISASVTDCVVYTDLAVTKEVSDSTPHEVQIIEFSITVSNRGPTTATSVEIGDVLPEEVQYNSHSNGNYVYSQNTWYVGTLPVYASTTLWINVTVREGTEGMVITNTAWLKYLDQLDVVATNNQDDAVFEPQGTWAAIASFRAYAGAAGLVVEWETAGENRTAGFDLQRWDEDSSAWVTVNADMVPGVLTAPQGGVYRVLDRAAPGGALRYRLVEYEFDGTRRTYGPYSVAGDGVSKLMTQGRGGRGPLSDLEKDGYERAPRATPTSSVERRARASAATKTGKAGKAPAGNVARLAVSQDGLYFVSARDLAGALGLGEAAVQRLLRSRGVEIRNRGQPVAYQTEGRGTGLYFYGERLESIYTDENVYFIQVGKGKGVGRLECASVAPAGPGAFWDWVHAERDRWASTGLFSDPERDFYLWEYLIAGNRSHSNRTFEVSVPQVALVDGLARLSVHLQGVFGGPHQARVFLNETLVGEATWPGLESHDPEFTFAQSLLNEGGNTVRVQAVRSPGVSSSIFAVNSFEIGYWREYRATENQAMVRADGRGVVTVDGFTSPDIRVWEISRPLRPKQLARVRVDPSAGGWQATFEAKPADGEFLVWSPAGRKAPEEITGRRKITWLTNRKNAADYVVITPEKLRTMAEAWAAWRQAQGWRTLVVNLEEIYEVFGYGLRTPWAIREFLDYAFTYWKGEPRYVLLVGKGTYDYKNVEGYGDNLLPAKLVSTRDGLFASDGWYADVVGDDGVPEMCVGRLPVLTEDEMAALMRKLQAYEAAGGDWTRRAMFVADAPDDAGDFPADSDRVAAAVPAEFAVRKYYRPAYPNAAAARAAILEGVNGGAMLLTYIGHGAYDSLGKEGLLRNADVPALRNEPQTPVVLGFTCLIGRFELPGFDCLGENLLMHTGGAAAVWSPSGLSVNALARALSEEFVKGTFVAGETLLGEIIARAQEAYADRYPHSSQQFMLHIYNLLGDPLSPVK